MDETTHRSLPSGAIDPSIFQVFLTVFPSIMLPMFLAVADQTIVASALPAIGADTGHIERISWIVVAYLLATTIAAPVYGYLGDMFGRRRFMVIALSLFIAASLACAAAPTMETLSAARFIQGLGGGGLMSLSQALVGEVVPARQRGHFQGYLAANVTASAAFGPVAGGFLTEHFGWRSIFLVNVPLGFLAIALAFKLASRGGTRKSGWTFDFFGLFILVATVGPVLEALQIIQRPAGINIAIAAALLTCSGIAAITLVRHSASRDQPLVPIALIRQRPVWMAEALVLCHGAALTSLVAFLPLYMRVIHGVTATESGFLLLPVSLGLGVGAVLIGRLVTRTGRTMIYPSIGLAASTTFLLVFAIFSDRLGLLPIGLLLSGAAFSMGTVMSVVQVAVQGAAGSKQLGAAAASIQLSRAVGAALGTAVYGTVVFASLFWLDPSAGVMFEKLVDMGPDALLTLAEPARLRFLHESTSAFRAGFLVICTFTSCGCLLAWLNPSRRV